MSKLNVDEIKKCADVYGLDIVEIIHGDSKTFASITLSDGENEYVLDKGEGGRWYNTEISRSDEWGYTARGLTGGMDVGLSYCGMLNNSRSYGGHELDGAMDALARRHGFGMYAEGGDDYDVESIQSLTM